MGARRSSLVALLFVGALLPSSPASAHDPYCTKTGDHLDIHIEGLQWESGFKFWAIRRDGHAISVEAHEPGSIFDLPCANATVTNTSTISITGGAGRDLLLIELYDLYPTDTNSDAPELANLEIDIDLGGGENTFTLVGSDLNDDLALGRAGADVDGDPGADVTWVAEDLQYAGFQGRGGDDHLTAGGPGSLGGPYGGSALMIGGPGNDLLVGGLASDWISGSSGNDVERGRRGNDLLGDNPQPFSYARPAPDTGDDILYGNLGGDTLRAGEGNDKLRGNQGADEVHGGPDTDSIEEGPIVDKGDLLFGDAGSDSVSYMARWKTTVYVRIDDQANDGAPGEHDWVGPNGDVEYVAGGRSDDVLIGDRGPDAFHGAHGRDVVRGRGGNDYLYGGLDEDRVYGGDGDDYVWGLEGDDEINGGPGSDTCDGGPGLNVLLNCP